MSLAFDHIGDVYLLIGGTEFNKTNEEIKWMNQYLDEDEQIPIKNKPVQVLIKFDKHLGVMFEHGYWPIIQSEKIAILIVIYIVQ